MNGMKYCEMYQSYQRWNNDILKCIHECMNIKISWRQLYTTGSKYHGISATDKAVTNSFINTLIIFIFMPMTIHCTYALHFIQHVSIESHSLNSVPGTWVLLVCDLNCTPNCYGKTWKLLCPFFRNLHLRENLARDCFTSTASTVTNCVQNISLPVYVIVTNTRLQPLTTTFYNSMLVSFSLLKI